MKNIWLKFISCSFLLLSPLIAAKKATDQGPFSSALQNLAIRIDSGGVAIEQSEQSYQWKYQIVSGKKNCRIRHKKSSTGWEIISEKRDKSGSECRVNWALSVPKLKKFVIHGGLVDIKIKKLYAPTYVDLGQGQVMMEKTNGALTINGGSCEIQAIDMIGTPKLKLGTGRVHFIWNTKPIRQKLFIDAGSAKIIVNAPQGTICHTSGIVSPPFSVNRREQLSSQGKADITLSGALAHGSVITEPLSR